MGTANGTANDTTDGQQTDSRRYPNKNVKNDNNVKNVNNEKKQEILCTEFATENHLSPIGDPIPRKLENLKISKENVQEKIKIEYQKALPFLKEKYPGRDYDLELKMMIDWADREITKARKRVAGDLNLFFQNWMRKARAAKPWEVAAEQAEKPTDWNCKKCGKRSGTIFSGGLCRTCYEGS